MADRDSAGLRRPSTGELRALAGELGLELSARELAVYETLAGGALAAYAALDATPDALPAPPAGERRWTRPTPKENPLNAWSVRTSIRERDSGPLAGCRVALKDNVMLAGVPMLNGSSLFEDFVPEVDATVVTRLLAAGAEIAGKAHCENLCLSAGSHTNPSGPVRNPHRADRTSGGSSSGSAALVAAGEVDLAVGGDQGGSIRLPAAYCGVVGLKPTWGLVPYSGIAPIEPLLDHVGPITASVRDNARMLEVMAGPDGIDGRQSGVPAQAWTERLGEGAAGLRIGVLTEGFGQLDSDPEVDAKVRAAATRLEKLGAHLEEVSVPEHRTAGLLTLPLTVEGMFHTVLEGDGLGGGRDDLYPPRFLAAARRWRERADTLSPTVKVLALVAAWVSREHGRRFYGKAVQQARRLRAAYDRALAETDLLLMPTVPTTAPPLPPADAGIEESFRASSAGVANTQPFDASHHPALSLPCGLVDGLPVGLMLVGRHHAEGTLYRAAAAFEQSADWRSL